MKDLIGKYKAEIGLAVLVLYTLSLGVATADEIFHLGLFPTKLEKMIAVSIEKWKSPETATRDEGTREIEEYGDFAVPQLIKALDREAAVQAKALESLAKVSGQNLGNDPAAWKKWYQENKDKF